MITEIYFVCFIIFNLGGGEFECASPLQPLHGCLRQQLLEFHEFSVLKVKFKFVLVFKHCLSF